MPANDSSLPNHPPTITDVSDALRFFHENPGLVDKTALLHTSTISKELGATVYLKPENLQKTGSFKIRGAAFKMGKLSEAERAAGVITASLGNHAQGVAYAAQQLHIPCKVFMPTGTAPLKAEATRNYGAEVILDGDVYDDAQTKAFEEQKATKATYVHAFNDRYVIAGQGTIGQEILSDLPNVDAIFVPIGGGGLISGIAVAVKSLRPTVKVIGVQAEGAQSAKLSIDGGRLATVDHPYTIADGISTKQPGELTLELMKQYVDDIIIVTDDEIARTVVWLLERAKLLVEGAGAASLAALRYHTEKGSYQGKRVVAVLSGGNIDATALDRFITYGMTGDGRIRIFDIVLPDRPGSLGKLLSIVANKKVNVLDIIHQRTGVELKPQEARVTLTLETINRAQGDELLKVLDKQYSAHDQGSELRHSRS